MTAHTDTLSRIYAKSLFELADEAGPGSTMKMINQLLVGVHIAAAMEAVALGIKSGLDVETLFKVITASAGNSWIFEDRVPHVLDNDFTAVWIVAFGVARVFDPLPPEL